MDAERTQRIDFRARSIGAGFIAASILVFAGSEARAQSWQTRASSGMSVELYTPSSTMVQGSGRGLMIVLHGCTQQSTSLRDNGNLEPGAEAHGLVMAVPQVPNGGVVLGCWDYYGTLHTRSNKHNDNLLGLVDDLLGDSSLGIDPDQVYIIGLSSGATQALVVGCLAPDVFAGVGSNAGPMVGTEQSEASFPQKMVSFGVQTCSSFAGSNAASFDTQLVSIIYGSQDFICARDYNGMNAQVFDSIYSGGSGLTQSTLDVTQLPGVDPVGTGTLYSDAQGARISLVEVTGMGHAFPAGTGTGPELNYIAQKGPAWVSYLAEFFSANNRRIASRPLPPDAAVDVDGGAAPDAGLDAGAAADAGGGDDAGGDASDVGGADAGTAPQPDAEETGCECVTTRSAPEAALHLFVLLGLALWRRRRACA